MKAVCIAGKGGRGVELSFRARISHTAGAYAALLLAAQAGAALCAALMHAVWPQLVQSGWGVWLVTDIPPVSYTHLDVYKRQG